MFTAFASGQTFVMTIRFRLFETVETFCSVEIELIPADEGRQTEKTFDQFNFSERVTNQPIYTVGRTHNNQLLIIT